MAIKLTKPTVFNSSFGLYDKRYNIGHKNWWCMPKGLFVKCELQKMAKEQKQEFLWISFQLLYISWCKSCPMISATKLFLFYHQLIWNSYCCLNMPKQTVSNSCVGLWIMIITDVNNEMYCYNVLPGLFSQCWQWKMAKSPKIGISITQLRVIYLKIYIFKARKNNQVS